MKALIDHFFKNKNIFFTLDGCKWTLSSSCRWSLADYSTDSVTRLVSVMASFQGCLG